MYRRWGISIGFCSRIVGYRCCDPRTGGLGAHCDGMLEIRGRNCPSCLAFWLGFLGLWVCYYLGLEFINKYFKWWRSLYKIKCSLKCRLMDIHSTGRRTYKVIIPINWFNLYIMISYMRCQDSINSTVKIKRSIFRNRKMKVEKIGSTKEENNQQEVIEILSNESIIFGKEP